ncbi:MAG TPA: imidazole glycerol phosphate synthase subunit HisH [Gemmatimonadales bacterium]|nr:imidazole glycerol phosphate synthase subunit HisH [Gemmatimonadales bacterium]
MIAVADYGASNTRSVLRALRAAAEEAGGGGAAAELTSDPAVVRRAERVVLPGVGNFAPAARRLAETGLGDAIRDAARAGRPVLGICLGLQLFLSESEEAPGVPGLGLLAGRVKRFPAGLPVPHVGWARVALTAAGKAHPVLVGAFRRGEGGRTDSSFFYHVHSYHPDGVAPASDLADAEYGGPFPTVVGEGNVLGVQFHPEKSQAAGLALLREFTAWTP